jgi:hypothetical protein
MRIIATLLLLAVAGAAHAATPVPKADLQLLAEAVRIIKQAFARPIEDARLATGCADSLAKAAGGGERTARGLDELPLLLERAHAAAGGKIEYRDLARHCVQGLATALDPDSRYLDAAELRGVRGGGQAAGGLEPNAAWLESGILHLRLQQFRDTTRNDLLRELGRLAAGQGEPRTILLDLRDNQGGLLGTAMDLGGLFLAEGAELGATYGRNRRPLATYRVLPRHFGAGGALPERMAVALRRAPMAILVNASTASSAEMLAGSLQANGRGMVVGQRTAGRGSVQAVFPLPGGAGLRLTSALWQGPKATELEGRPLEPDLPAAADVAHRDALRWLQEWK